jgi:hypothetical protein
MKFLNLHQNPFIPLSVLAALGFSILSPAFALREKEIGMVGDRTVSSQYELLRELERKLKDFFPEHRSIVQTLIQLHGFEIVPKIFDHVFAMKRYEVRDQKKEIVEQFSFLTAYKKNASDEQWEALKLLIQTHGFDPVLQALRSQEETKGSKEEKKNEQPTSQQK